jgi:hypothetical protein
VVVVLSAAGEHASLVCAHTRAPRQGPSRASEHQKQSFFCGDGSESRPQVLVQAKKQQQMIMTVEAEGGGPALAACNSNLLYASHMPTGLPNFGNSRFSCRIHAPWP